MIVELNEEFNYEDDLVVLEKSMRMMKMLRRGRCRRTMKIYSR